MSGWTKLFSNIIFSTIWREDNATRLVWVTMLAMANKHGIVEASIPGLSDTARVDLEQCERALKKLSSPDPYSRSQDFEGRRIEVVPGGWRLLNYEKYRNQISADRTRELAAERMRQMRERKRTSAEPKSQKPSPAEPPDFAAFWSAYPRKIGKLAAAKAWKAAAKNGLPAISVVVAAIERAKATDAWLKDNGAFIPHPATWLNQGRWDDDFSKRKASDGIKFFNVNNKGENNESM